MTLSRRQFVIHSGSIAAALATVKVNAFANALKETGLKDVFKNDFHIGTAIGKQKLQEYSPAYMGLVAREFSAITMENEMKWERVHPTPEVWAWDLPDRFVAYGKEHGMFIAGHVLVWHSQTPAWVFENAKGKRISKEALLERMANHIDTLAGRYRGQINSWDVVNEAIDDEKGWRKSLWYEIIGPEFIDKAFHFARDADPKAELLYNDYSMHLSGKRRFLVDYIERAKKRGVPIQSVGMQGHVSLNSPEINEFEESMKAYIDTGMKVHITEFDIDVLPEAWKYQGADVSKNFAYSEELNPYSQGLPAPVEQQLSDRYVEFFKLFIKYREHVERVTMWGTSDGESWKNDFPVKGRTNYPLLFDRHYQRKPCYNALVAMRK